MTKGFVVVVSLEYRALGPLGCGLMTSRHLPIDGADMTIHARRRSP
jgi:hypothetical protein